MQIEKEILEEVKIKDKINIMINFLKDNPNYYIDGGKETNNKVKHIIDSSINFKIKKNGENGIIETFKKGECIGWITFIENENNYKIIVSSINQRFRGKGYGKQMYINLFYESKKNNKNLITQSYIT